MELIVYTIYMKAKFTIGVDEVGRGPLAGPITVCAVIIPASFNMKQLVGVHDSKKMSEKSREEWYMKARAWKREGLIDFCIRSVSARAIDEIGIARATRLLVRRTLLNTPHANTTVKLDGLLHAPARFINQHTITHGDSIEPIISLASVVAKIFRDRKMRRIARLYPKYGFERHVGYGTKEHYSAIKKHGLTPEHRRSFLKNL